MACAATTTQFTGKVPATAMPPAGMTLEVTVVSAEEVVLKTGRVIGGGAYAAVRTASSVACTHVDEDGDCNGYPYWGEAVRVCMPAGTRGLDVEVCRRRSNGLVESVAAARVPVDDFTVGPPGHLHCLSYRLFDAGSNSAARRNGIVNITVRRTDVKYIAPPSAVGMGAMDAGARGSGVVPPAGAAMGYPVAAVGLAING